jgi:hypothetical protein
MVDPGNVDKHRLRMSGLKVTETEKWGRGAAISRYGQRPTPNMKAKDGTRPQSPEDKQGPGYDNIHPNDWVRSKGESAEGKPGFVHGPSPSEPYPYSAKSGVRAAGVLSDRLRCDPSEWLRKETPRKSKGNH